MAIFEYNLSSGSRFRLTAPAGTTLAQADQIFYQQVASGAFIGYEPGQTLTSAETKLIKFELSRLDRGTAGVDTNPVLAINQSIDLEGIIINFTNRGLSIPPGFTQGFTQGSIQGSIPPGFTQGFTQGSIQGSIQGLVASILNLPVPISIPDLEDIALSDPIDESDIIDIKGDDFPPVGVIYAGSQILTEYQTQKLLAQIAKFVDQESDQISLQKGIGRYGFTAYALEQAGYVKPGTSLKFFANNPEDFVAVMSSPSVWTGRVGVYSLDDLLSDSGLQNQIQSQLMQQGYDNLVANGIIVTTPKSSIKISTGQVYTSSGLQSTQTLKTLGLLGTSLTSLTSIDRAALANSTSLNRLISTTQVNLNTIISGAVGNLSTGIGSININTAGTALANQITGSVGSLVANASKFGTQATALWARSTSLTGVSDITKNLTNLVPPNLSGLTSNLDILGKASGFATNFANPLSSLNNLGNLGGALTGQLGSLQGALTGQLGGLTGAFGNLGSLTNIGSLGGLFGGGGDLVSGTKVAGGFNNTVNRSTVDAAFARVVGSSKVPLPIFQYPSLASLAPRLDLQQAQNFLQNQLRGATASVGQAVSGQVTGAARSLFG
jgi:hypothetical protein